MSERPNVETITLEPEQIRWAHQERERGAREAWAEAEAQALEAERVEAEAPPQEKEKPAGPLNSCGATVEFATTCLVFVGGKPVDPLTKGIATELCEPAWEKYGGEIPYAAELMGLCGLYLLYRAAFPKPDPTEKPRNARQPARQPAPEPEPETEPEPDPESWQEGSV